MLDSKPYFSSWAGTLLDGLLIWIYLVVLNQSYPPESEEPTNRAVTGIEWILKAPLFYSGCFLTVRVLDIEKTAAVILIIVIVTILWELLSRFVLKLPSRIYTRLVRHRIRARAETFLATYPSMGLALMVLISIIIISWIVFFSAGAADYILQ